MHTDSWMFIPCSGPLILWALQKSDVTHFLFDSGDRNSDFALLRLLRARERKMAAITEKGAVEDMRKETVPTDDKIGAEDVGDNDTSSREEIEANLVDIPEAEARRILSKVDYRLVPMLALLYLVAFIDRSNSKFCAFRYFASKLHRWFLTEMQLGMRKLQVSQMT